MTSPVEVFALQLSRASLRANRFLRQRNVRSDARDDIIASAILWCWENRDNYSLTVTLDTWFLGAVRNSYRDWLRGELRNGATDIVENMGTKDSPEYNVTLRDAAQTMSRNMDEIDRAIVQLRLDDRTHAEISTTLSIERSAITKRLNRLGAFIPESAHVNTILRRVVTPKADDMYESNDKGGGSWVDKEIAALDFPPAAGKECPPCWRCKWFEGYLPGPRTVVRMNIAERAVKAAVLWTERRKKRIANEVRDGNL